ncbi:hypothetical protein [Vibrio neptunius]|uniref:hypothetical protein n=1 Tax=Vibrio neptunius TaxID=170651 RepID=UPI003CE4C4F7
MGGKSSSSNTTNTHTEVISGSVGIDGSNSGTVMSGIKGTVNVTTTDHGAVNAALKAVTQASTNNLDLSKYAIGKNTELVSKVSTQALVNAQSATTGAMDMMKNITMSNDPMAAQNMTKYLALSVAAIGVAAVLRGKL